MAPLPIESESPIETSFLPLVAPGLLVVASLLISVLLCGCGGKKKQDDGTAQQPSDIAQPPLVPNERQPENKEEKLVESSKDGMPKKEDAKKSLAKSSSQKAEGLSVVSDKSGRPLPTLPDGSVDIPAVAKRYRISEQQVQTYVSRFKAMDVDSDGTVSKNELMEAMKKLGQPITDEQATKFMNQYDKNKSGMLELKEFLKVVIRKAKWQQPQATNSVLATFKVFDKDGDGCLAAEELCQAMAEFGDPITVEEAAVMLKQADKNGDGRISYAEFAKMWQEICT